MRKLISNTVFSPIGNDWRPDKVLAVLFHRSAATLYFIYFVWGLLSIFGQFPQATAERGDVIAVAMALLVIPTSFLAFLGSTYFPRFARLEMFSAASLVTILIIYEIFVIIDVLERDPGRTTSFVLNLSFIVIPIARVVFIYVTLIKQAGEK